jgi:hypothetical protein
MTLKEKVDEIVKCKNDCEYFIFKYCKISHPIKGIIPFELFSYQKDCLKDFQNKKYNIILKSRQIGITTLVASYSVWLACFHSDKNILAIATKDSTAQNIIRKVDVVIRNCPKWLLPKLLSNNKGSKEFDNGSIIKAIPTSADAGRTEALSLLLIDEAAHIDNMQDLWPGIYNTLQTGGDCIAISTPNGVGNWFHLTWVDAINKNNDFNPIVLPWNVHPERDEEWRKKQDRIDKKAAQEHDVAFLSSGTNVIGGDIQEKFNKLICPYKEIIDVRKLVKLFYEDDEDVYDRFEEYSNKDLHIWELPEKLDENNQFKIGYIVGVDNATGDGSDSSTAIVLKCDDDPFSKDKVVATFKSKIPTDKFGIFVTCLAKFYNNALLIIENTGIGKAVVQKAEELEYENLFFSPPSNDYDRISNYNSLDEIKDGGRPGFTNSTKTRPLIVDKLVECMYNYTFEYYDERIKLEIETFIYKNGKAEAMPGFNDDLVLALCFALWARIFYYRLNLTMIEHDKSRLESTTHDNKMTFKTFYRRINKKQ